MDIMATSNDTPTRPAGPADLALPLALARELVPAAGAAARPPGTAPTTGARTADRTPGTAQARTAKPGTAGSAPAPANAPANRVARRRRATVRG